jgi:hypothetical protein
VDAPYAVNGSPDRPAEPPRRRQVLDAGYHAAAAALLAVSRLCWAVLLVPVLRHWKTPTAGVSFLLTVATEALAVLGATLALAAALGQFSGQHQVPTTSTLVLWCLAVAWLLPLVTTEILRPRLGYDVRR